MQNILLVTEEARSYLPMSIKERLDYAGYVVTVLPADTDAINGFKDPISGILIFADEKLIRQQLSLNYLKDKALMDDIPIFAAGEPEQLKAVKVMIPKHLILQEFLRPVDVNNLVQTIDTFIRQFSSQVKKKILVVDDSGAMLRSVKGWLEDKYNVFLVNSGAMAIKYLALNRPDLVLLDYEMPVCDGKQVLEMMRTEMEFADIPVMFLTSKGDKESIVQVKALKPEGYLLKTMLPAQIIKAVDDFFAKRKGLV